ncbi:MAG: L-lactate permease [Segniliparus sp.]|uniref:L-lactate permease n=1 Tax=Segniliparus sp. TaxID=2804064 RepID=UPI003F3D937F
MIALQAILAAAPLVALFLLVSVFGVRAHKAVLISLALALLLATALFRQPVGQALSSAAEGALFGVFPMGWTIFNAVWLNKLQRATRYFNVVGRTFCAVSSDARVQAILVAFCFGSVVEAVSGFGTPTAITSVMLMSLGFQPVRAAIIALFAEASVSGFGPMGTPVDALAKVTGFPAAQLGGLVGLFSAIVNVVMPFVLLALLDGRRALRELWPVGLVVGISFGGGQYLCARFFAYQLTDVASAVCSLVALGVFLRLWTPPGVAQARTPSPDSARDKIVAFSPYVLLTAVFAVETFVGPVRRLLAATDISFHWPGLPATGLAAPFSTFHLAWASSSGTTLFLVGVASAALMGVSARRALAALGEAAAQIRVAAFTIAAMLALAYVINISGMALALGSQAAELGRGFAFLSAAVGWFGVVLTGSDTTSNALFGGMQAAAATRVGLSPSLLAAANSAGGFFGKPMSLQSLALAGSAVGLTGREGELFRISAKWCVPLLAGFCLVSGAIALWG